MTAGPPKDLDAAALLLGQATLLGQDPDPPPSPEELAARKQDRKESDWAEARARYLIECFLGGYHRGEMRDFESFARKCVAVLESDAMAEYPMLGGMRQKILGAAIEAALSQEPVKRTKGRRSLPLWLCEICYDWTKITLDRTDLRAALPDEAVDTTAFTDVAERLAHVGITGGYTFTTVKKARARWARHLRQKGVRRTD